MVPGRRRQTLPGHHEDRTFAGNEPRPGRAEAGVDRVARRGRADAPALRTDGGTGQRGVAATGLRGCGSVVAVEVRHATGRVCERTGSRVGTVASAVSFTARVRARATGKEIRRKRGAAQGANPRAPAGKSLGAGVEQRLRPDGFAEATAKL